eukprot:TRINITY_DN66941_c2_g1_i7.p1 TRINITY_DN66941_c2_g1~~TRINITY_DN66941_c2_g1_i7.p1  ORF type:complete len:180 (-),score=32.98 TRINITY_DN66941_c2_g1_i7:395-934(-)
MTKYSEQMVLVCIVLYVAFDWLSGKNLAFNPLIGNQLDSILTSLKDGLTSINTTLNSINATVNSINEKVTSLNTTVTSLVKSATLQEDQADALQRVLQFSRSPATHAHNSTMHIVVFKNRLVKISVKHYQCGEYLGDCFAPEESVWTPCHLADIAMVSVCGKERAGLYLDESAAASPPL